MTQVLYRAINVHRRTTHYVLAGSGEEAVRTIAEVAMGVFVKAAAIVASDPVGDTHAQAVKLIQTAIYDDDDDEADDFWVEVFASEETGSYMIDKAASALGLDRMEHDVVVTVRRKQ